MQRTIILPDSNFPPKMIMGVQYMTGDVITVLKDVRKTIPETINPNSQSPEEMSYYKPPGVGSFKRQVDPRVGKWVYTTSLGTILNYVKYNTAYPDNKKILTKQMILANSIIGVSPTFDCALTFVSNIP